jgi:hypothetical protein
VCTRSSTTQNGVTWRQLHSVNHLTAAAVATTTADATNAAATVVANATATATAAPVVIVLVVVFVSGDATRVACACGTTAHNPPDDVSVLLVSEVADSASVAVSMGWKGGETIDGVEGR